MDSPTPDAEGPDAQDPAQAPTPVVHEHRQHHHPVQHPIEVDTRAAMPFVRSMALIGKRYAEREKAQKELGESLAALSKDAGKRKGKQIDTLRKRILRLAEAERQFAGYRQQSTDDMRELEHQMAELEAQVAEERNRNEFIKTQYRRQVEDMKRTFAHIKSRMLELIEDKRRREDRLEALQERIRRMPHPLDPGNGQQAQQVPYPRRF